MTQEQWQAIRNKDKAFDGAFYYTMKGSRRFCCPSCESRDPEPARIIIFDTPEEAIAAGYHPCLRCRPDRPGWQGAKKELASSAVRWIENNYKTKFSLKKMAGELFVNESYLLRVFKEVTGDTPLHYHNRVRCEAAKELLTDARFAIADVAAMTGFNSASHFTRIFREYAGVTPTAFRSAYFQSLQDTAQQDG